jgi:hypothetical protein
MGVIEHELNDGYFFPGSFCSGALLDRVVINGFSFSPEFLIDCRTIEVSRANKGISKPQKGAVTKKMNSSQSLSDKDDSDDSDDDDNETTTTIVKPSATFVPSLL